MNLDQSPGRDIETTELGYYLLQELIGMSDRELAQKIELDIWANQNKPRPSRLALYCKLIADSEDEEQFYEAARTAIKNNGLIYHVSENCVSAEVPRFTEDSHRSLREELHATYVELTTLNKKICCRELTTFLAKLKKGHNF